MAGGVWLSAYREWRNYLRISTTVCTCTTMKLMESGSRDDVIKRDWILGNGLGDGQGSEIAIRWKSEHAGFDRARATCLTG